MPKKNKIIKTKKDASPIAFSALWFSVGFFLTAFFLISFIYMAILNLYKEKIYEGIFAENIEIGGKTKEEVFDMFETKNQDMNNIVFTLKHEDKIATFSAATLKIGYNSKLITDQAYSIGRSDSSLNNIYTLLNAYINGLSIPLTYTFAQEELEKNLQKMEEETYIEPIDALFTIDNGKVAAFKKSREGKTIDFEELNKIIKQEIRKISKQKKNIIEIEIPIKTIKPKKSDEEADKLGIVEEIGTGQSFYRGSIANRIYNLTLATSKLNGVMIAPDETFSFNKTVGDISKETGYKEAYVIQNGKTILGDGGGVCQVSSTLFRAVLNAGLPVIERYAHAYRVYYYEQNSYPGLDATVFSPSVDFKFKNDTGKHILIQAFPNPSDSSLTFTFYGKNDGRKVEISTPVITKQTPPPPPVYEDDPTLPKDTVKQIEHEAWGARVIFTRKVFKDNKLFIDESFVSNFAPWKAVYLKGTKEG